MAMVEDALNLAVWQSTCEMTQAKTKRAKETRTDNKARTEPPWKVILHNSWHPMSWVVYVLVRTIPGTTIKKATKIMWKAHTKGRAVAATCHKELAELYEERLRARGLTATVEPAR